MGFEIPIDVDYFDHPKTQRIMADCGDEADVFPLRLWRWAAMYCPKGILGSDPRYVEGKVGWKGKGRNRGKLLLTLIRHGFIDLSTPEKGVISGTEAERKTIESDILGGSGRSPGVFILHGWADRIGRAIAIYEAKKQKQRLKYAQIHGILPEDYGQKHPYSGNSGVETQEGIQEDPPPPPPADAQKDEDHEVDRTVAAFVAFVTPSPDAKANAVRDLRRQGFTHAEIRDAAHKNGTSDFYDVVKSFRKRKSSGVVPYKASPKASCRNCGGSGTVAGGVEAGKIVQVPCSVCQKAKTGSS